LRARTASPTHWHAGPAFTGRSSGYRDEFRRRVTSSCPTRNRQAECIRLALIAPTSSRATSISSQPRHSHAAGDIEEVGALRQVFGDCPDVAINNTKSFIGHAMGAAGALELLGNLPSFDDGIAHATSTSIRLIPSARCRKLWLTVRGRLGKGRLHSEQLVRACWGSIRSSSLRTPSVRGLNISARVV